MFDNALSLKQKVDRICQTPYFEILSFYFIKTWEEMYAPRAHVRIN